jgi:hypothetical protein
MTSDHDPAGPELPPEVLQAVKAGRKIEAIKLLRGATGMGLANAKVLIDAAARRHGVQREYPSMTDVSSSPLGLIKLLLFVISAYLAYRHFLG